MMKRLNSLISLVFLILSGTSLFCADLPVVVEAESGQVGSSFTVATSGDVTYVTIKPTVAGTKPDSTTRVITYSVTFPDSGTYDLYARLYVGANTFDNDSYYYGNGFGLKDVTNDADWVRANMLSGVGYSGENLVVDGGGNSANKVWVWLNMSKFTLDEAPISFRVELGDLTQVF